MSAAGLPMMIVVFAIALALAGCGTPKEKSAPCKRPAGLAGYGGDTRYGCGAMRLVNPDAAAALAAIEDLAAQPE